MTNNVRHIYLTFADIAVQNAAVLKSALFIPIQMFPFTLLSAQFDEFCLLLVL
jgi:hypothetical protein